MYNVIKVFKVVLLMWSLSVCPSWIRTNLTRPPLGPSLTGSTLCRLEGSECSEDAATATRWEGKAARTTSPGSEKDHTCQSFYSSLIETCRGFGLLVGCRFSTCPPDSFRLPHLSVSPNCHIQPLPSAL